MPEKLRLRFEKTGRAIYISHLDLMRTMQRVFLRADCPLKYSEGFNPHALISILLPLSVGLRAGRRPLLPHGALSRRRNALPIISKFLKLGVDIFQRHDIITLAFDMRECWNR